MLLWVEEMTSHELYKAKASYRGWHLILNQQIADDSLCILQSVWVCFYVFMSFLLNIYLCLSWLPQSQAYRSQPDLVSAVYDTTSTTLAADYSYASQYANPGDATQNYSQYMYPSDYPADSTWIAPEQRKQKALSFKTIYILKQEH